MHIQNGTPTAGLTPLILPAVLRSRLDTHTRFTASCIIQMLKMNRNVLINRQFGQPSSSQCVFQFRHVLLGIAVEVCLGSAKQDWQRGHLYSTGEVRLMHRMANVLVTST